MKQHSLPILLILMMLMTPIASAFDHCAGMSMPDHLSASHLLSDPLAVDDAMPLDHEKMLNESQSALADMDCHSSDNCTVHLCGACGITSSAPTINILISSYYSIFEYVVPYDTALSPGLRPPKPTL